MWGLCWIIFQINSDSIQEAQCSIPILANSELKCVCLMWYLTFSQISSLCSGDILSLQNIQNSFCSGNNQLFLKMQERTEQYWNITSYVHYDVFKFRSRFLFWSRIIDQSLLRTLRTCCFNCFDILMLFIIYVCWAIATKTNLCVLLEDRQ